MVFSDLIRHYIKYGSHSILLYIKYTFKRLYNNIETEPLTLNLLDRTPWSIITMSDTFLCLNNRTPYPLEHAVNHAIRPKVCLDSGSRLSKEVTRIYRRILTRDR